MYKQNEKLNKVIETFKNKQTDNLELKDMMTELKTSIKSFNIRLKQAKESVNSKISHLKLASQWSKNIKKC